MDKLALLHRVTTFTGLTNEQLAFLGQSVGSHVFARTAPIFHQGAAGDALYIIVHGQVRIYTTSVAGQELTIAIFRDNDFFGEMALLDGQPRAASAEAMYTTTTLTLERAAFLRTIDACPPIAAAVLEVMSVRLRQSNTVAGQLANLSASQRVVQQLIDLAQRYGVAAHDTVQIDLHLTQEHLASLSGTTRETVNRVLASLQDQGVIRVERARVSVLSIRQLEATRQS